MKHLAFLLIGCIISLSCFSGIAGMAIPAAKADCCKKMKMTCHRQSNKQKQHNSCDEPGCAMMFSCSICGFIVKDKLTIQPIFAYQLTKPVVHYITGNIAAYHADNWKPPKAC